MPALASSSAHIHLELLRLLFGRRHSSSVVPRPPSSNNVVVPRPPSSKFFVDAFADTARKSSEARTARSRDGSPLLVVAFDDAARAPSFVLSPRPPPPLGGGFDVDARFCRPSAGGLAQSGASLRFERPPRPGRGARPPRPAAATMTMAWCSMERFQESMSDATSATR